MATEVTVGDAAFGCGAMIIAVFLIVMLGVLVSSLFKPADPIICPDVNDYGHTLITYDLYQGVHMINCKYDATKE